ncbi:hypothetical protein ACP70R_000192 [Stipagrostis hirtigluma subsp. patula]
MAGCKTEPHLTVKSSAPVRFGLKPFLPELFYPLGFFPNLYVFGFPQPIGRIGGIPGRRPPLMGSAALCSGCHSASSAELPHHAESFFRAVAEHQPPRCARLPPLRLAAAGRRTLPRREAAHAAAAPRPPCR